jgi:NAD-dependent dihydropyrimidine dehydrogenase PreA subunit
MANVRVLPALNTLRFEPDFCVNCGACLDVCPHGVFAAGEKAVRLVHADECMECGACQKNCPTNAMIYSALTGKPEQCG